MLDVLAVTVVESKSGQDEKSDGVPMLVLVSPVSNHGVGHLQSIGKESEISRGDGYTCKRSVAAR